MNLQTDHPDCCTRPRRRLANLQGRVEIGRLRASGSGLQSPRRLQPEQPQALRKRPPCGLIATSHDAGLRTAPRLSGRLLLPGKNRPSCPNRLRHVFRSRAWKHPRPDRWSLTSDTDGLEARQRTLGRCRCVSGPRLLLGHGADNVRSHAFGLACGVSVLRTPSHHSRA